MKKLMTTMLAVAVGVGLHAIGNADTGTSFEGLTGDAPYDIFEIDSAVGNGGELTPLTAGETYWVTNDTATLTVVAGTSLGANKDRPTQYQSKDQYKYLSIKTTLGNPVTRKVNKFAPNAVADPVNIGNGYYFDSLVKFTAFDEDPAINLDGGKLAVWLKENLNANDEPVSTNLVITAGFLDANLQAKAYTTNYVCTVPDVNLNDGAWHRVTVKAIDSIYKAGIAPVPGFVVFVDKKRVVCGDDKGIINKSSLTDNAYVLDSEDALFPSADQNTANKLTIDAVQFDGQGDVDDLVFTSTVPFDEAKDAEFFAINLGEHVTGVEGLINGEVLFNISAATSIVYAADQTVQILTNNVTCETGWMVGSVTNQAGAAVAVASAYTTTAGGSITVNAKPLGAYVDDTPYETLAAAVYAANQASGNCTVKLAADATAGVRFSNPNSGVTITLDLAGNEIAAATTDPAAILVEGGAVSIIDSVGGGKVTAAEVSTDVLGNAVVADGGAVTITAGTYDGKIIDASITGGGFLVSYKGNVVNTKESLDALIVGNYEATINSGTNYYVLTEKKPTYVAQIGETGYETLAAAVAAAKTIGDASAPVTITLLSNVTAGGIQLATNDFDGCGLVLDLGGYTYTITGPVSGSSDPIDVRAYNMLTISNGTLGVSAPARDLVRIYGTATSVVTFKDVAISGDNLEQTSGGKPVGVLQIEGGTVNFIGSTSIDSGDASYAIKFGNHADKKLYSCETVTFNTTGDIVGDILLTGGTYVETAIGGGSSIDYFYGTNVWSTWEDANNVVFAARDGELSATGNENDVSGKLYKTFAEAFAATNEFTLLENYAGNVTFTMATKIKANGHELTGTLTAPAGYVVRLVDGVYQAALPSITCVLGGGTQAAGSDTEYTVNASESQTKTIVEPTSVDSNFTGWVITPAVQGLMISGTTLTIPAGLDLDITLTATWEAKAGYPTYVDPNDADVVAQYTAWANTYVADTGSAYETAFLLNVAPDAADQTLDVTAITISGTTVSITLDHQNLNGYVYVYEADTLAGLDSALPTLVEESAGVITRTSSDSAKFYKIVVSAHPIVAQ